MSKTIDEPSHKASLPRFSCSAIGCPQMRRVLYIMVLDTNPSARTCLLGAHRPAFTERCRENRQKIACDRLVANRRSERPRMLSGLLDALHLGLFVMYLWFSGDLLRYLLLILFETLLSALFQIRGLSPNPPRYVV